jgi:hypothetical protein
MSYYSNEVENTNDYLEGKAPMIKDLMDIEARPDGAEIFNHLRMIYGHVLWNDMLIKLSPEIISLLKNRNGGITDGEEVMGRLKEGCYIAILNPDTMGAVTYNEMITNSTYIELADANYALEKAAYWFVDDIMESNLDMKLTTVYFVLAFRLALMEGEMDDKERFAKERIDSVWCKTYSKMLVLAGKMLQEDAADFDKNYYYIHFEMRDHDVEDMKKLY